jgi:hypothetical protein
VQLSTLRRVIQALGGCIQIFAKFPEGRFTLEDPLVESYRFQQALDDNVPSFILRGTSTVFAQLSSSGKIQHAMDLAGYVKRKRTLLEMV